MAGRPSKLTPQIRDEFCKYVEGGLSNEDACLLVGIERSTYYSWMAKGEKANRGKYVDFREAVTRSRVALKRKALDVMVRTAEGGIKRHFRSVERGPMGGERVTMKEEVTLPDARSASWLLERKYPEEFGRNVFDINAELGVSLTADGNVDVKMVFDDGDAERKREPKVEEGEVADTGVIPEKETG